MELETLARDISKKYMILLNNDNGLIYGSYNGIQIIYGRNTYNFPKKYMYQDFLIIQNIQNSTKITLTHIQGDQEFRKLELMIPSVGASHYKFNLNQCNEPYNQLGIRFENQYTDNVQQNIPRIESLDLKNFDNVEKVILKLISPKHF